MDNRTVIWNKQGRVTVQIYGNQIFDTGGREIGYIDGEGVYDRTGRHIGWFIGGILRDMYGRVLGFSNRVNESGKPHPPFPEHLEGAPASSLEGSHGKPGLYPAPGRPLLGGKPPLGESWADVDAEEYFTR